MTQKISAAETPPEENEADPAMDHAFDDLLANNREFAKHFDLQGFDGVAHAGVLMVTCMDSRIWSTCCISGRTISQLAASSPARISSV